MTEDFTPFYTMPPTEEPRRDPNFGRYVTPRSVLNVLLTRKHEVFSRDILALAETFAADGIDISKWNWPMDFSITAPLVDFVYSRGGYGSVRDPRFTEYRTEMLARGIPFGIYWFVYAGYDIDSQVNAFVQVLNEGDWVLPPCADFEYTNLNKASTTAWIKEFMEKLQARVPDRLLIYTSPGWWNAHVDSNSWAAKYRLWVAHWTTASTPILPSDWTTSMFWQWSADGNRLGSTYGSGGDYDMDLDRFQGTAQQWADLIGDVVEPPPPGNKTGRTTANLNVRMGPNTYNDKVDLLPYNTPVTIYAEYRGWYKIDPDECKWVSGSYVRLD